MEAPDREIVLMIRRPGDPVAPTISDISFDGFHVVILERPRKPDPRDYAADGKPHPCINGGEYDVDRVTGHPKHPDCWQVMTGPGTPSPDRTDILIHSANWIRELLGCLAPGIAAEIVEGDYEGQHVRELGVSGSKLALNALEEKLGKKNFRLIIKEAQ